MERAACSRAGNLVGPGPSEGLPRGLAYEGSGALPVGPAKARPGVAFLRGTTPPQRPGGVPAPAEHGASVGANGGCRAPSGFMG